MEILKGWTTGLFESKALQRAFGEVIKKEKKSRSLEEKMQMEEQRFFSLEFVKMEKLRLFFLSSKTIFASYFS